MKKILSFIIFLSFWCSLSFAQEFIVSCEGYIEHKNIPYDSRFKITNKRDNFYEDYSIKIRDSDKKIDYVEIVETSSWGGQVGFYASQEFLDFAGKDKAQELGLTKLEVIGNGEVLKFIEEDYKSNENDFKRTNTRKRLSIVNGIITGSYDVIFYNDDGSPSSKNYYNYTANCSGTDKVLASLGVNTPSDIGLPKINDNEIVAASSGTGFFVSKQGHLVTNNHVIEGCTYIKAIYNGIEYDSKVLAVDRVNDLAFIKSEIKPKMIYSVSNQDAQLLEDVIVAGYPLGKKVSAAIKATSGTVTALAGLGDNYAEFQTDAALNSGNSGGPIINDMGNVVGVAVSKINKEGVDSFNFGIKSSILKVFANANGFNFSPPGNKEMKKKDLGALITEATIYLDCWMTGKEIKKLIAQDKKSQKAFYSKFSK